MKIKCIQVYLDIHLSFNPDTETFGSQVHIVNLGTNSSNAHIVAQSWWMFDW